jgi:hypothetical protein
MDENVSLERLREFPVVYVPNAAILSEKEIALFDEYAAGGGNLLFTGLTGLYDRYGRLLKESSLAPLLGVKLISPVLAYHDNYIRLPESLRRGDAGALLENIPPGWPALTWGPAAAFEAAKARSYGEILVAFRSPLAPPIVPGTAPEPPATPLTADKSIGPAVFVKEHGKGRVVYVPCSPDAALMSNFRIPENRYLIRNLIRLLRPKPMVNVDAPLNVEAVVGNDEVRRRLLVHLVCFSAPPTATAAAFPHGKLVLPPMMEEPMAYDARVQVSRPFSKARAFSPDTKVVVKGDSIHVRTSAIHEIVIIEA